MLLVWDMEVCKQNTHHVRSEEFSRIRWPVFVVEDEDKSIKLKSSDQDCYFLLPEERDFQVLGAAILFHGSCFVYLFFKVSLLLFVFITLTEVKLFQLILSFLVIIN